MAFSTALHTQPKRIHQDDLPPEPDGWNNMLSHPYKDEFLQGAEVEFRKLEQMNTWAPIKREALLTEHDTQCKADGLNNKAQRCPRHQVLPLRWVFTYKTDKDGFISRYKARLCVRGDLQAPRKEDTRATTLAARTLRTMLAITAVFDLETMQMDAVNAFLNSKLNNPIYVNYPQGYGQKGYVLRLNQALYGLRISPILWQQEISQKLTYFGLNAVPEDPCLFINNKLALMIFVDDMLIIYHQTHRLEALELKNKLRKAYELKELGEISKFIGIRIIRDRPNRKLWICQDNYIEKITHRFHLTNVRPPKTPLPSERLAKRSDGKQATQSFIHQYQEKNGSLLWAAIMTRPDIAKTAQYLSEFLTNPSEQHMTAIDKAIAYLYNTRFYAIEYSPILSDAPAFILASDASFADNSDRKSSEGYIAKLFNGPIDWHAQKQKTVTTSTTEAELLAISSASKHVLWWKRLFRSIDLNIDQKLSVLCDNSQTVDLLTKVNSLFRTKLKHIDIHHHWLRQEILAGNLEISWVPTNLMPADGLTKPLSHQKHQLFQKHLNMVNILQQIDHIIH
jgi:hypothetical protein